MLFSSNYVLFVVLSIRFGNSQILVSPCPNFFEYESNNSEKDRWYGVVTVFSNETRLEGIWLRLLFDKSSTQLGASNWLGEVVTQDNKEYLIKNLTYVLERGTTLKVRFYVRYNPKESPPQLLSFSINSKIVCPENLSLLTAQTNKNTTGKRNSQATQKPLPYPVNADVDVDEDFFQGDFAVLGGGADGNNLQEDVCGTVIKRPRPLITHGQETHEGEYPWHAAIYHAKKIDLTYICGASLISRKFLLTVAHCVTRRKSRSILNPGNLVIYLGKHYLTSWANSGIQNKHVEKIVVHPEYDPATFHNDIAILKLHDKVNITDFVRPVCLWQGPSGLEFVIDKQGTVVGWGYNEKGTVTEELTKAQMPIVSQETCIYSLPDFYSRFTSSSTFCAGFKNGTSVCNGDSGGGLVLPRVGSDPENPIWQIRGLVSISVALQNQFKCDSMHFVVFTDVAKHLDWINNALFT